MLPKIILQSATITADRLFGAQRWMQRLSLDAPAIAVGWHFLFADPQSNRRWRQAAALGLSVWSIYLIDRYFDVRAGTAPADSERHSLFQHRPDLAAGLTLAATTAAAAVSMGLLRRGTIHRGLLLGSAIAAYLTGVNRHWALVQGLKETLVGIGFAAGVYLPTFAISSQPVPSSWSAFAAACVVNAHLCDRVDQGRNLRSLAVPSLALVALTGGDRSAAGRASLLSLLALAAVALLPIRAEHARSGADLALFTPLLLLRRTL